MKCSFFSSRSTNREQKNPAVEQQGFYLFGFGHQHARGPGVLADGFLGFFVEDVEVFQVEGNFYVLAVAVV